MVAPEAGHDRDQLADVHQIGLRQVTADTGVAVAERPEDETATGDTGCGADADGCPGVRGVVHACGVGHQRAVPSREPSARRTTTVHGPLTAVGSLRVREVEPRCPRGAKPPIAGRAVSTRLLGVVVESVGVGSETVAVASAGGGRGGGWVELPPRVFAATASPSARTSAATNTRPRGLPAARGPSGSTPTFSRMSPASHRRRLRHL